MESRQAELELSLIKKMMEDTRKMNIDNGIHYIFWGVLVAVALFINYLFLKLNFYPKYVGLVWMVLMVSGAVADIFIAKYQSKRSSVSTYAGRLMSSLWLASGVAMFIYGFIGPLSGAYNSIFICPIIATSLGISYFTSGSIQQLGWLRSVSFGWWAGAIVMFIFPGIHTLLVFAVMIILLQIVPGILLNIKSKKFLERTA
ncbi:MAG TPA: hypothetical protein PLD63_08780 [Ignavibacteria bacterium]|nr:hypothetical protein [Ignavibacteria bacterium]HQY52450.1 hypothetical protein [Ignavibacteria bacterium]